MWLTSKIHFICFLKTIDFQWVRSNAFFINMAMIQLGLTLSLFIKAQDEDNLSQDGASIRNTNLGPKE